jgi:hypothetical protein
MQHEDWGELPKKKNTSAFWHNRSSVRVLAGLVANMGSRCISPAASAGSVVPHYSKLGYRLVTSCSRLHGQMCGMGASDIDVIMWCICIRQDRLRDTRHTGRVCKP